MSEITALALAVLRLADAIEEGSTNATARSDAVYRARKHAHTVLDRHTRAEDAHASSEAEEATNDHIDA